MKQEKFYYYYLRDPVNEEHESPKGMIKGKPLGFPRISICIGVKDYGDGELVVARGISICSFSQEKIKMSKERGRKKAKGMVVKAFKRKINNEEIIRFEAFDVIDYIYAKSTYDFLSPIDLSKFFEYRSNYQPELTDFEKKLVKFKE